MFEISIPQMKNCIEELGAQEQEMKNLVARMEAVYTDFDGLVEDKSDKKALKILLDELVDETRGIAEMKQTLAEIVKCYEETEKRITECKAAAQVRNQFGLIDLSGVSQMLDSLNITFK